MTDNVTADEEEATKRMPGVIASLGELGEGAVLTEAALAALFHRHPSSVKRAVERGELPMPVRMFGSNVWTIGVLIRHLENRLSEAADQAERDAQDVASKMIELSP